MAIYEGSRLRIDFVFQDVEEDGTVTGPIDLTGREDESLVRILRPNGTEIDDPLLVIDDAEEGQAHWNAAIGVLDQAGVWRAQGEVDGHKSDPVVWRVLRNP